MITFNDKIITVINRLKAVDSLTKQDVFYKTILHNCAWYTEQESNITGSNVLMGSTHKVMIPFNPNYLSYAEWVTSEDKENYFTMSENDYIIKGEVKEDITVSNFTKLRSKYEPNVCDVRVVKENTDRGIKGVLYQIVVNGV